MKIWEIGTFVSRKNLKKKKEKTENYKISIFTY